MLLLPDKNMPQVAVTHRQKFVASPVMVAVVTVTNLLHQTINGASKHSIILMRFALKPG